VPTKCLWGREIHHRAIATDDLPRAGAARCPAQHEAVDRIAGHHQTKRLHVAKPDIGTKRVCPETGRKFYDLNKDPIVSPYTGMSYPLSYFESGTRVAAVEEEEEEEVVKEVETEDDAAPEIVALEEAEEDDADADAIPGIEDEEDVEIDDDDDDTFLADDDDDDDDVADIIGVDDDDDN